MEDPNLTATQIQQLQDETVPQYGIPKDRATLHHFLIPISQ